MVSIKMHSNISLRTIPKMLRNQGFNSILERGGLKISLPSLADMLHTFPHQASLTHYYIGFQEHIPCLSLWLNKWQTPILLALGCIAAGP